MRFGDFLKATVLLSAGTATLLAAVTVIGLSRDDDRTLLVFCAVWWIGAVLIGIWLGRRAETSPPIARLLATARTQTTLPELRPGTTIVNRLWPLLVYAIAFSALGVFRPPVAAVAAGGAIIWALAWRRQERAVLAIEQRDGVKVYVVPSSALRPVQLVRSPGLRSDHLRRA